MNLAFFGTSAFAVPALRALHEQFGIALVVTQPDRPVGRHATLTASAVKQFAMERDLPIAQPESINETAAVERLRSLSLDAIVVASYGQLLKPAVFESPRWGTINIHASVLPAYRGAAPVNWAIMNGETTTGVTTFFIEKGLDTGDVLMTASTTIGPEETADELEARLAQLGADVIVRTLRGLSRGTLRAVAQPEEGVSSAPSLTRQDGHIDWSQPAARIHDLVRGTLPWPGAWTTLADKRVKILRTQRTGLASGVVSPGAIGPAETKRLLVGTEDELLEVLELQREGKPRTQGSSFLHGIEHPATFS
jgi:methionyl-tRNA formyltransferase